MVYNRLLASTMSNVQVSLHEMVMFIYQKLKLCRCSHIQVVNFIHVSLCVCAWVYMPLVQEVGGDAQESFDLSTGPKVESWHAELATASLAV